MPLLRALHASAPSHLLTVNEWIATHGKVDGICPACGESVLIRGASAPNTDTHFSHYPNAACPTVTGKRDPFRALNDIPHDRSAAVDLVRRARYHMRDLFLSCQGLVTGLTVPEFESLLEIATTRNVWYLKGLNFPLLPFVLVSLHEQFEPNQTRAERMFLVFPSSLRRVDQLWNAAGTGTNIMWRVYPATGNVEVVPVTVNVPPGEWDYVRRARLKLPNVDA